MVEDIPTEQHMLVPSFIGGGRKRIHPLPYADPSLPWSFQVAEDGPLLCLEFQIQISLAPARWIVLVYYNLVISALLSSSKAKCQPHQLPLFLENSADHVVSGQLLPLDVGSIVHINCGPRMLGRPHWKPVIKKESIHLYIFCFSI